MGFDNPFEPPQSAAPPQVASPEVVTARDALARGARLMAETPLVSFVFALCVFLASLAPPTLHAPLAFAVGSIVQPFEIEWWAARERGETPDLGRALSRLPMVFAMNVVSLVPVALGIVLLVVPGVYLLIRFAFVATLVVLEGHGWSALAASRDLARGRAWTILAILAPAVVSSWLPPLVRSAGADGPFFETGSQALGAILQTWEGAALTVLFVALRPRRSARASASVSALRTPAEPR